MKKNDEEFDEDDILKYLGYQEYEEEEISDVRF